MTIDKRNNELSTFAELCLSDTAYVWTNDTDSYSLYSADRQLEETFKSEQEVRDYLVGKFTDRLSAFIEVFKSIPFEQVYKNGDDSLVFTWDDLKALKYLAVENEGEYTLSGIPIKRRS